MTAHDNVGRAPLQPLQGIAFTSLGQSRTGRVLANLLSTQGARMCDLRDGHQSADIIIDDRSADDDWSTPIDAAARQIVVKFVDFPHSHPESAQPSRLNDDLIHAELGINALSSKERDKEPLRIASTYGAIWGAIYLAAALRRRDATGCGAQIEISLFGAALTALGRHLIEPDNPQVTDSIARPLLPLAEIYRCADGRFVQSHGTYANFAEILCEVAKRPEWKQAAVAGLDGLADAGEVEMWQQRFAAVFQQRDAGYWEEAINRAGGSCTICRTRDEWLASAHARQLGIAGSPVREVPGVRLYRGSSDDGAFKIEPPEPGVPSLPLAGITVVDFCIVLAGPTCGRTLAELGADVIKIDQPDRKQSTYAWLDVNRGKRSMLLDLKHPEGLRIARSLVQKADIVAENFRPGKLDKLGIGYDAIRSILPDVVFASLNAFDHGGEWSPRAGWEHNAQAMTGMQTSRAIDGVAKAVPLPVNDYATGLLGAFGVLLAMRHTEATGSAARVEGSLVRTATLIQAEELAGDTPAHADATQRVKCHNGDLRVRTCELSAREQTLVDALVAQAKWTDRDEMAAVLRAEGIYVAIERTQEEVRSAGDYGDEGLRLSWEHPHWGPMRQVRMNASSADILSRPGWPAPDPGTDSIAILQELGYSAEEIDGLLASGAVTGRMPLFGGQEPSKT